MRPDQAEPLCWHASHGASLLDAPLTDAEVSSPYSEAPASRRPMSVIQGLMPDVGPFELSGAMSSHVRIAASERVG